MVVTLGGSFPLFRHCADGFRHVRDPAYQGIGGFPAKNEAGEFVSFRLGKSNIFGIPSRL